MHHMRNHDQVSCSEGVLEVLHVPTRPDTAALKFGECPTDSD